MGLDSLLLVVERGILGVVWSVDEAVYVIELKEGGPCSLHENATYPCTLGAGVAATLVLK